MAPRQDIRIQGEQDIRIQGEPEEQDIRIQGDKQCFSVHTRLFATKKQTSIQKKPKIQNAFQNAFGKAIRTAFGSAFWRDIMTMLCWRSQRPRHGIGTS